MEKQQQNLGERSSLLLFFDVVWFFRWLLTFCFMCLTFLRKGCRGKGKSETYVCSRATVKIKSQSAGHAAGLGRCHWVFVGWNLGFLGWFRHPGENEKDERTGRWLQEAGNENGALWFHISHQMFAKASSFRKLQWEVSHRFENC